MAVVIDRYIRQSKMVDQEKLGREHVLMVGTGAVGYPAARMLAAAGVKNLCLVDLDVVEEQNCTTQMWKESDEGKFKAEVCANDIKQINNECNVTYFNQRWRPKLFKDQFYKDNPFTTLFNCVDSLNMRKKLFNYYKDSIEAMFDARIGGQQIQIVSVWDEDTKNKYESVTGDDKDAYEDEGCHGVPMISFSAVVAAGFIVQQFISKVQGNPMYFNRGLSFHANELYDM